MDLPPHVREQISERSALSASVSELFDSGSIVHLFSFPTSPLIAALLHVFLYKSLTKYFERSYPFSPDHPLSINVHENLAPRRLPA